MAKASWYRQSGLRSPQLADAVGLRQTAIAEIEAGHINRPKKLREISKVVRCSEAYLLGEKPDEQEPPMSAVYRLGETLEVPVVGRVEAGAFRVQEPFDDVRPPTIVVARDKQFPKARMMAFEVVGDSMIDRDIHNGSIVIAIDFADTGLPLMDEMVVIVQRTMDSGHSLEWTIKEVKIERDHLALIPRSPNKRHKPIVVRPDFDPVTGAHADDGSEVKVLAVARWVHKEIKL